MNETYLAHYGVKGMKWGQHIFGKVKDHQRKVVRRQLDKETERLVADSKNIKVKADPGKTKSVMGQYTRKTGPNTIAVASHVVDEYGDVKLSYILGQHGNHFVAAGKDTVSKLDLDQHFKNLDGVWDYDVYADKRNTTKVNKNDEETNRREKIRNMSEKERQKAIDEVNAKFQKKWDELNERYAKATSSEEMIKIDSEFDLVDADWMYQLDELNGQ